MASIVKRGQKYAVVYDLGRDADGKRQQKWESGFSYKEAQRRKAEIDYMKSRSMTIRASPASLTLSQFYEIWLPVYQTNWQYKTYQMATDMLTAHVLPYIGTMKLSSINPYDIEHLISYIRTKPSKRSGEKTLSATTVHHTFEYIRLIFNKAVEWGYISDSPVKCKPPSRDKVVPSTWSAEVLTDVLTEMHDEPLLRLAVHLAFVCSLRIGELLAITLDDIDYTNGCIYIYKALQRVDANTIGLLPQVNAFPLPSPNGSDAKSFLVLKDCKTPSSNRKIFLTPQLQEEIQARITRISEEAAFHHWQHNGLLFCLPESGNPIEPNLLQKWFRKWQGRNPGRRKLTFHQLRHSSTHFKLTICQGDIKSVQGDNGHANITMTLDKYAHIEDNNRKLLSQRLAETLYK